MEGYELKKLSDVELSASAEGAKVLIEQDGEIKRVDKDQVGAPDAVQSVNGTGPDENGNVEVEVPEGFSGSYNDLTDKPFETLDMCPIAFLKGNTEEILSFDDSYGEAENFPNSISAGVEYHVMLLINPSSSNIEEIQVTAMAYQHEFDSSRICIKLSDFFTLEYRKSQGFIVDGDDYYYEGEPCTMSIYRAEQVKKLDEKYLPDTVAKKEDMFSGSWNDLQDRPFGEEKRFETIEWDGDTTGRDSFSVAGIGYPFCKIADVLLDAESLTGATLTLMGQSIVIPAEWVIPGEGGIAIGEGYIMVVTDTHFQIGDISGDAPSTGVYALSTVGAVRLDGTAVKKLDSKYLENSVMVVTFRQNDDGDTYTADKTRAEVESAEANGALVVGRGFAEADGRYLHSNPMGGNCAEFTAVTLLGGKARFECLKLPDDNTACELVAFYLSAEAE